ncbi:hypothetical protein [Parvibaculum sp.]|uniref:hypothetical protein n=1 Tax=Parvibaculum sp. TaxID=2024848 RepID=UPI0025FB844C|nr:hypothetical protein [Parvibaculum sp.]
MTKGAETYDQAEKNASVIAPRPKYDPIQYAFAAAIGVFVPGVLILSAYGIDPNEDPLPLLAMSIVAAAGAYGITWNQQRKHYKVVSEEYRRLSEKKKAGG